MLCADANQGLLSSICFLLFSLFYNLDSKITKEVCSHVWDIVFFSLDRFNLSFFYEIDLLIFVDQNAVYQPLCLSRRKTVIKPIVKTQSTFSSLQPTAWSSRSWRGCWLTWKTLSERRRTSSQSPPLEARCCCTRFNSLSSLTAISWVNGWQISFVNWSKMWWTVATR